ncbi:transmembrane protein 234 homolog [Solanum pennellii]|uniref:Transmembrane protein 234 homolog n=1 Tax=Solanum pennellii TaxID=28526 RepID=A0ABM1HEI0_SOLPN|nr:transmembrane protein 234 homolog [Solanum pennellii]
MVTVGLVWGATNALMRKGAIKWDETIKSLPQPNTPQHKIMTTLKNWFKLLLIWQCSSPFCCKIYQHQLHFFAILSDTPISLAVPVTSATTFAATAVFGMILGEENLVSRALFGTFLIVLGVYICIM